jgi:hypothetical protein
VELTRTYATNEIVPHPRRRFLKSHDGRVINSNHKLTKVEKSLRRRRAKSNQRIDHQPATLPKIYCQQGARQPGDIISYRRATSSWNQRATSSESAPVGRGS